MKKLLLIAAAGLLSVGSAYAGNAFGDGSPENTYVIGTAAHSGLSTPLTGNSRAYTRANGFGGGSVDNRYVPGHAANSGLSVHSLPKSDMSHFGDGSPANQQ
ncbi:hypothetical protein [Bartonella sp. LJL80]